MMRSLIRWSATLGLIGSTIIGSTLLGNLRALALPLDQVLPKLQSVPVFTITDESGAPLVASSSGQNNNRGVAGVFISQKAAEDFVKELKKSNPELGNKVRVVPLLLGDVYKLSLENQNKPNGLDFTYVPVTKQVEQAETVLKNTNPQQKFNGTPLFFAVAGTGANKAPLTIQQNNQPVIPFFFEKEQLQSMVEGFKQKQPELASTVQIQVVNLEGILQKLQTSDDRKLLEQFMLYPSQESIAFLRSLSPAPNSSGNQQNPQR